MLSRVISATVLAVVAAPAMGQQIKISQAYGGGGSSSGTFTDDYVELFNAGAAPVDLSGMTIQYGGFVSGWTARPLAGVIQPGSYFLIRMNETTSGQGPVPVPYDYVVPNSSLPTAGFRLVLVNDTAPLLEQCPLSDPRVMDAVGFGTANCWEGAAGPGLSATTAGIRLNGGCTDTGVNAADFVAAAPSPRNSSSPANLCPWAPGADLAVALAGPAALEPGAPVTYEVRVTNYGPDAATGVTLTAPVPPNSTFESSSPPNAPVGGVLTFALPDMPLGATEVVSVTVAAGGGPAVPVTAEVAGAQDPFPANNTAAMTMRVYVRSNAKVVMGVDTPGAPVVAVDVESGAYEALWTGGTEGLRGLASDDANRRFYFVNAAMELYRVSYDPPRAPVLVGTVSHASIPPLTNVFALAFDPLRMRLIANDSGGELFAVDPVTAEATLLRDLDAGGSDIAGMDFDPVRDRIIVSNNGVGWAQGRGLYLIDPLGTEVTLIAAYPNKAGSAVETDIDGVACGDGMIYPAADERNWLYRFSESGDAYLPPMETAFDSGVWGGATFTSELFNPSPGANLAVSVAAPGDCSVAQGSTLSYTVTVRNLGPDAADAGSLVVPLPAGTTFQGSIPPLAPVGGELVLDLAGLAAGADATLTVNVTADLAAPVVMEAAVAGATTDPFPQNNSASAQTLVTGAPSGNDTVAIFSTMAGSNEVPEYPWLQFDNAVDLRRPVRSYNGNHWAVVANTTDATQQDDVLLLGSGASFSVVAQEHVTVLQTGEVMGGFDAVYGVNDSGRFAFSTNIHIGIGAPPEAELVVKATPLGLSVAARGGTEIPSLPGSVYGPRSDGATIQNDGTVSFHSAVGSSQTADGWFTDDGNTLVAQEGVTVPANQAGGLMDAYSQLDSGATFGQGIFFSADGERYAGRADVGPPDDDDLVLVVDGGVVIQQGYVLPGSGLPAPVAGISMNYMEPHGDWFAYGANADGQDWVVRNGAVLAARGDEIFPGAGAFWDDTENTQSFFLATGNRFGDYVVAGMTGTGDFLADAVVVLNGDRVVLRENDPVDLDGDGMHDDDAYIHAFRDDCAWLGEDGYLYAAVRLRDGAGVCSGSPEAVGQAFIRTRVFCPADWDRDGSTNSTDISAFLAAWLASVQAGTVRADVNGDMTTNSSDISEFLARWLGALQGGC